VSVTQTTSTTSTTSTSTSTIPPVLTASFTVSPTTAQTGQQVMVNGGASFAAPGRRIVAHEWDFGDGVKKSGVTSSHDYDAPGTFPIILTVTDDAAQKALATQSVTITQGPPPANAQYQFAVIQPPPSPDVPADLTLLFQLLSAGAAPSSFLSRATIIKPLADPTYNIAPGSFYVRSDKTGGIVKGQFVGTVVPLNGKFSGSLTYVSGACTTERVFSGVVGDFLEWTGGPLVVSDVSCAPTPWTYTTFSMVRK
jgi:hypothetical protein